MARGAVDADLAAELGPAPGVVAFVLGGRTLLFVEDRQQLLELNETAAEIWRSFATAGSGRAAVAALDAGGLTGECAHALVEDAAGDWLRCGYLTPRLVGDRPGPGCEPDRIVMLDELAVEIRLHGVQATELDPVFGHLYPTARPTAPVRLTVIDRGEHLLFYVEGRLICAGPRQGYVALVKAILTDLYLESADAGFLTHGALLMKDGRRLLLSGEPGAGKTTLALALAAHGWRYGSDDIVRIGPDGAARGVPFAAAVKPASLPLLTEMWPALERLPAWTRSDGQVARYLLPPERISGAGGPLDVIVTLARAAGRRAQASSIAPVEALGAIIGAGYARSWRMTPEAIGALAATVERATCARLRYSSLQPAIRVIERLAGV